MVALREYNEARREFDNVRRLEPPVAVADRLTEYAFDDETPPLTVAIPDTACVEPTDTEDDEAAAEAVAGEPEVIGRKAEDGEEADG